MPVTRAWRRSRDGNIRDSRTRATTEHTGSDPSALAPLQDANGAFRAFAQVFALDRMPRVKALTELGVRRDQDVALFRKACLEAADELGAALAGLPE
jgi:hypothetical protein